MDCFVASWVLAKIRLASVDEDSTANKYKKAEMTYSASVSDRLMVRTVADAVHAINHGCCRNRVRQGLSLRE